VITASGDLLAQLPLATACAVLDLGRESYYRVGFQQASERGQPGRTCLEDPVLWEALEQVVLEFPGYGYLRVTKQLQRAGFQVNPKRVYRLMREAGWLHERARRTVRTTDSEHGFPIYPNLLAACGWRALTAPNQAWGADLTYIRLGRGFCYLAVLLDLFSRRIVGWNLSESLEATGAVAALEMALASRQPRAGWIHHSDRGVQYACREYVQRLKQAEARISMAAVGAPKENAPTERWMRTVKEEEVELEEYDSFPEAKQGIGRFIEEVYNQKRLHSGLGYRPPSEFEEIFAAGILH
jgi:transposase InsO family protein